MKATLSLCPVRIGLIGLGRTGAHHLERISLRNDLKVVAAAAAETPDAETSNNGSAAAGGSSFLAGGSLCREIYRTPDELLRRDDVEYVLIAAPQFERARLAVQALERGKNVALEPPMSATGEDARTMIAAARRTGRRLCVLPSRREGIDFRAAEQAVESASLGAIYSARLVSWGKAVPAGRGSSGDEPESGALAGEGAFGFFAWQYVDQLMQLIRRQPAAVFARILEPPPNDSTAAIFTLWIGFQGGGDAFIDVNLHCGAPHDTGWMLAGARGGYCNQRIYLADASGEMCDAPLAVPDSPTADLYADLLRPPQSDCSALESAESAATVMRVIDAARESSRSGRTVAFESFDP